MNADDREGPNPNLDLVDRYERMIETQIRTLHGIDEKAATVTRFVTLLLAVVLSGVSFAVDVAGIDLFGSVPIAVTLTVGFLALVTSVGYAILTYLSSVFEYGPSPGLGEDAADFDVPRTEYVESLLRVYPREIRANRRVVRRNARRFRNALAALLVGITSLSLATALVVLRLPVVAEGLLIGAVAAWSYRVVRYFVREEYLTLEYGDTDNDYL